MSGDPLQVTKQVPGPPTDGDAVYGVYTRWCQAEGKAPVDQETFLRGLAGAVGALVVQDEGGASPEQFAAWVVESGERPLFIRGPYGTFIIGLSLGEDGKVHVVAPSTPEAP